MADHILRKLLFTRNLSLLRDFMRNYIALLLLLVLSNTLVAQAFNQEVLVSVMISGDNIASGRYRVSPD